MKLSIRSLRAFTFIVILLVSFPLYSQTTYEGINSGVYDFLSRMHLKGIIDYSKLVLPITRSQISQYINRIKTFENKLTETEKNELIWYQSEFYDELSPQTIEKIIKSFISTDASLNRRHLFYYRDTKFLFKLNPVLGYSISKKYSDNQKKYWSGVSFYGTLGEFGFQFDYRDNSESGNQIDRSKKYSNETGIHILGGRGNSIEYSEVRASIHYQNDFFDISVGKDCLNWGSGYRSRVILSDKAPSFPFIRLDIKPANWLSFYYIHGWLNSRVIDSLMSYETPLQKDSSYQLRIIEREKFIAAHVVEIKPIERLKISIGESIIYSDQGPRMGFLIPILFFRLVDHYYEGTGGFGKGGNSQFFADINVGLVKNFNFYSTIFIDEFSLTNFLKGKNDRNQLGYTIGFQNYGLVPNLNFVAEYTRILPWVYSNFIQTQTYTNSNYLLGHYIGQNADHLFLQFDYRLMRGLELKLWGELIRQGGFEDISQQYSDPGEPFLYGLRRNETNLGLEITYEYVHDLSGRISYQYSDITDEDGSRTPGFMMGKQHSFSVGFYYGL